MSVDRTESSTWLKAPPSAETVLDLYLLVFIKCAITGLLPLGA